MGIVYKARHKDLNRTVALKLLRGAAIDDLEFRERFHTEAEAVARLQHPNIIQVFEIGTVDVSADGGPSGPFIALEYVDGGSLARLAERAQEPREAARIVAKLAAATAVAHEAGIVHRDLKPANILLTADGEPKIADFGLAKRLTGGRDASGRFLTQAGTIVGTPEYMAPEQAAGADATPAVDVYALGIILYELLTGRVPFQAATPIDTMGLVRNQDPVSPRRFQPGVPRDLDIVCLKCLEKDPARRYATAKDLLDDLCRFLDGRPIRARQTGTTERVVRWCRRNPLVAISLTAVVAIFLTAFGLVSRSYWRAEDARQKAVEETDKAVAREKAERWEHYQANILAAASALQVHNVAGAGRELEAAPDEHRAWEWRHFTSKLDSAAAVLGGIDGTSEQTRVTPGGRRALIFLAGGRVAAWDPIDGRRMAGVSGAVEGHVAEFSPDGRVFARSRPDATIELFDVDTGRPTFFLRGHSGRVNSIRFSTDGSRLVTRAADKTVRVWDTSTGTQLHSFGEPLATVPVSALSPDARRVATGVPESEAVELWDLDAGARVASIGGLGRRIFDTKFSPDGRWYVTIGNRPDYVVRVWDATTGAKVGEVRGHKNNIHAIAFSPDGTRFATGSMDQTIFLYQIGREQPIARMNGHRGWIHDLEFSPDGNRLISASQDHTLRLWDGHTGELIDVLHGHTGEVFSAAYTAEGSRIVSAAGDGTVRMWDVRLIEANGVLRGHTSYVYSVAVHPDGERIASGAWDGTARLWQATSGRELAVLEHGRTQEIVVSAVAFQPGGRLLATRTRDLTNGGRHALYLWDVEKHAEIFRWPVESDVWRDTRLAFSPDGSLLATGVGADRLGVWNVTTKDQVALIGQLEGLAHDVAFSPDGRHLAAALDDSSVRVWNTADWTPEQSLTGHTKPAYCLAFSDDGQWLASGSNDGTIRVWQTDKWTERAVLQPHCKVYGLAFTPDGSRLACGCVDNAVRLWATTNFQEVAELRGHTDYVHSVAFTPDGTRLVSGSGDGTVRVWDTLAPQVRALIRR
jgi:WD40 repeat protein/tRNA A-37 threonylcarbamoyl transferase component Bud32